MKQNLEKTSETRIRNALVIEISEAKTWIQIEDAWRALLNVRIMARSLKEEPELGQLSEEEEFKFRGEAEGKFTHPPAKFIPYLNEEDKK